MRRNWGYFNDIENQEREQKLLSTNKATKMSRKSIARRPSGPVVSALVVFLRLSRHERPEAIQSFLRRSNYRWQISTQAYNYEPAKRTRRACSGRSPPPQDDDLQRPVFGRRRPFAAVIAHITGWLRWAGTGHFPLSAANWALPLATIGPLQPHRLPRSAFPIVFFCPFPRCPSHTQLSGIYCFRTVRARAAQTTSKWQSSPKKRDSEKV